MSKLDYESLLKNYSPDLVSYARNLVLLEIEERKIMSEKRNVRSGVYKLVRGLEKHADRFTYELLSQGLTNNKGQAKLFLAEKLENYIWGRSSVREDLKSVIGEHSKKGQITYEIGPGHKPLTASLIYDMVGNKKKIFLVDPVIWSDEREKEFKKYGTRLTSYVESFRIEDGRLVTDIFNPSSERPLKKVEVPFADIVYMYNVLPFVDSGSKMWDKEIYKRGYSNLGHFVNGLSNIAKQDGKVVVVDFADDIERFSEKLGENFRTEGKFSLYRVGDPRGDIILGLGIFKKR